MANEFQDLESMEPIEERFIWNKRQFVVREADAAAVCSYRNKMMSGAKLGPEGKPVSIDKIADAEPHLVWLCLREVLPTGEKELDLKDVRALPNRVQRRLFDWIKRVSELDVDETEQALEQRIAELQLKLKQLKEGKEPPKNEQKGTTNS